MSDFQERHVKRGQKILKAAQDRSFAPHCDARVLHRPGSCWACDGYPDWQQMRNHQGINFTGEYDEDRVMCPSEHRRALENINRWPGNQAAS